jgi:hypothetical protein
VPQLPSDAQKVRRVELALSLLWRLETLEQRAWHDIVSSDESWFYCSKRYESMWLSPGEKGLERPRVSIQCNTLVVTIGWNPSGFHLMCLLPNGRKCNSNYYRREILESLSELRREQAGSANQTLIVRADHAHPQTPAASQAFIEENRLEKAIHPSY